MSLKHALLGFLNYGPMTGYEVKKFFDVSVAHFWNAELSQIYPALRQMESEGLVEMEVDVQDARPNRKVYSITDDGRRELLEWLAQPADKEMVREPVLIKVFFGSNLKPEELVRVLRSRIDEIHDYLTYLEGCSQFINGFTSALDMEHEAPYWLLTTKLGLKHCQAELEWAQEAIEILEQIGDSGHTISTDDHLHIKQAMEVLERISAVLPLAASVARKKEATNAARV